jgi:hypothetical protein
MELISVELEPNNFLDLSDQILPVILIFWLDLFAILAFVCIGIDPVK